MKVVLLPAMMWYWRTSAVTVLPARAASVGAKSVNGVVLSRYWVRLKLARALRDKHERNVRECDRGSLVYAEREESPPLELGELEAEKGLAEVEREVAGDQDLVVSPKCRG